MRLGNLLRYALGILALSLLIGAVDRHSPLVLQEAVRSADQRKELPPEEYAYWRRHERHQSECRGQTYVAQCCDSSFDAYAVTCLKKDDIR